MSESSPAPVPAAEAIHPGLAAVGRSLRYAFLLALTLMCGLLAWYLTFGGYFTVGPQESVLVLRFGRIVARHDAGWHWAFPAPVHELVRVPVSQRTVRVASFWPANLPAGMGGADGDGDQTPGPAASQLKPGTDGYLLTGDANIIHAAWAVSYRVADPETYYRRCLCPADPRKPDAPLAGPEAAGPAALRGPETLLRHLLETAVVRETAGQQVDDALYRRSDEFARGVGVRLADLVRERELGLEVVSVELTDKTPPAAVFDAFVQVIAAEQESQKERLLARREATGSLGQARADAARLRGEAESYRKRVVADVAAESAYFQRIRDEFRANPGTVLFALYTETLAAVLPQASDNFVVRTKAGGRQEVRIQINAEPAAPAPAAGRPAGEGARP